MAGIGGITYGESQYASSGSNLTGNKLFKEFLYFQEERSWLTSFTHSEAITVAEGFATHLAEIWERFIDYIEVSHVRTGVSITKIITEIIALQETFVTSVVKVFTQTLAIVETFFIRRREEFIEYIEATFSGLISLQKRFRDYLAPEQAGEQRISGIFTRENLELTYKKVNGSIAKVFKETITATIRMVRRFNGVLMGWTKKQIPESDWTKRDNVDTTWEKTGRTDV